MHILHFLFEKGSKKFILATKSELCIPFYIDSPSCCHGNNFYLATKFRNIMNDLETQFEHSVFNSDGQDETPYVAMVTK